MSYIAEIETTIAGIPCLVGVTEYHCVKGSYSYHAASDWDYYGYTDLDYVILDRKGYKAAWLERKVTDADTRRIEAEIAEYFND